MAPARQQISENMAAKVQVYEAKLVPLSSDAATIDDEKLWHDFGTSVRNIEDASEMAEESWA